MSFYDAIRVGASGAADFEIERSLRFNDNDGASLTRTQSTSPTNAKKGTLSFWLKRANIENNQHFYNVYADNNNRGIIYFRSDTNALQIGNQSGGTFYSIVRLNRIFRDVSAWYHIVIGFDTTQGTAADRIKVYVNGSQETSFHTANYPSQNDDIIFFNRANVKIGAAHDNQANEYFDGYATEFNYIDGTTLTPSSFGETNSDTGQWVPIDTSGLTFGTNGYRLNFSDNSGTTATTLGKDSSGNGNNFTPNNFSVAAGAGNDSLEDTPTNNFCTLNPLSNGTGAAPSNGNLDFATTSSATGTMVTTIPVSSGKWYCEATITFGSNNGAVGIREVDQSSVTTNTLGNQTLDYAYRGNGQKFNSNSKTSYGSSYTTNDVIGIALDLDGGTIKFFKNNSDQGTAFSSITGTYVFAIGDDNSSSAFNGSMNFGQRAFTYTPPAGFKALNSQNLPDPIIKLPNKHFDTTLYTGNNSSQEISTLNFQPDWLWFKSRSSTSWNALFDSVRGRGQGLASNNSNSEYTSSASNDLVSFDDDGFTLGSNQNWGSVNGSGNSIVTWAWNGGDTDGKTYTVKVVSDSGNKYRFDNFGTSAVTLDLAEGGTYTFDQSDSSMSSHPMQLSTTANGTHGGGSAYSTGVTYQLDGSTVTASAFISGFSSATSRKLIITVAASAPTLYYYCYYHSGMGGAVNTNSTLGSSNFDGTLQATVKANTTAGFSIITWTGNQTSGATLGHGLGVAPKAAFVKRRDGTSNWISPLFDLQTAGKLNSSDAFANSYYNVFFTSQPSSTLITIGSNDDINRNTSTYVAYVFSEVSSYNKFASYTGNGSTDGTFVFTGFRPAWVLISNSNAGFDWVLQDSKRSPGNVANKKLNPNQSAAEQSNYDKIDILSNGFKPRVSDAGVNANGSVYYYWAFAESPFKNSRAR